MKFLRKIFYKNFLLEKEGYLLTFAETNRKNRRFKMINFIIWDETKKPINVINFSVEFKRRVIKKI